MRPLATTTIGSYPRPSGTYLGSWWENQERGLLPVENPPFTRALRCAARDAVSRQLEAGIEVPSDGEVRRDSCLFYFLRCLEGVDFSCLIERPIRAGAWTTKVPTVRGELRLCSSFILEDFLTAQDASPKPVKISIPGPVTMADTVKDAFYPDEPSLLFALADVVRENILALVEAGCTWVQIDEPAFLRYPERALALGIESLERCFHGVPSNVHKIVHICAGYPDRLDNPSFPFADASGYKHLFRSLEDSTISHVSLKTLSSGSFTESVLHRHHTLIQANLDHPFVAMLGKGSLQPDLFRNYLLQDAYYLREYARVLSFLGSGLLHDDARLFFQSEARVSVLSEQENLLPYYLQFDISKAEILAVRPNPTCLLYTSYLKSLCGFASYSEVVAAVAPCFIVYAMIAKQFSREIYPGHPYLHWIRSYESDMFQVSADKARFYTDQMAEEASPTERERMEKAFRTSLILEWKFWSAALETEVWPEIPGAPVENGKKITE